MRKWLKWLVGIVLLLSIGNVFLALFGAVLLRGTALNGKMQGDHYFIGDRSHFREVPHWVWIYSEVHMMSMFYSVLVCFAAYVVLALLKRRGKVV